MTTNRTRYHVGFHATGLDPEYRVECIGDDFAEVFAWLEGDISGVAENVEDDAPFNELYHRFATCETVAELVGEHMVDTLVFFVRPVTDCGCPCDCAEHDEECDGVHRREAAAEPKLAEPDAEGRSTFEFDGDTYAVFNTASEPLDGFWAVSKIPAGEGRSLGAGINTRENAFALAVEKLRPTRLITFLPRQFRDALMDDDDRREYPTVTRMGWVLAWNDEGAAVLFEDREPRALIYPDHPIEVQIITAPYGRHDALDGKWKHIETAALAARAHTLDARS